MELSPGPAIAACQNARRLPYATSPITYGDQMEGPSHEQRSTETCPNGWYRSDAKDSAVEMGWTVWTRSANE